MSASGSFVSVENEQKVYAIGDIHGCINTLKALLDQIDYKGQSPLFLLGDYVNKGPSSVDTLNFIIDLKSRFPKVFPLAGNHDQYLLSFLTRDDDDWLDSSEYANMKRYEEYQTISADEKRLFVDFLLTLPLYYETETTFFVHAGFNFESKSIFDDTSAMINTRAFHYDARKASNKRLVHGHLPVELAIMKKRIEREFPVIPLDNGCVYSGERKDMGSLCCLELNKMKLFTQPRID
ncbi:MULTISPECIES: metallophosphoesterase family protein [unclassified Imperialibacter]|uniref:metallophosphoesterase family protein n=1 Tax=unclassified Imperialibacter TaxID=2629706 RepID=UPI001254A059|nr:MULTISPECIES: metallophosphoesterase family protein [unclassified Imperialibacter]CAD5269515.1 Serine/threonine protein phosphatase [Imperialibacter sp. 89]CAD5297640.1 Serine/threonine protein phosphatase [Imperialibacter sp. 75]VVT34157.1 Serine/threonine protein phosphatase [Imperialibacter sp. EC-SDR9]